MSGDWRKYLDKHHTSRDDWTLMLWKPWWSEWRPSSTDWRSLLRDTKRPQSSGSATPSPPNLNFGTNPKHDISRQNTSILNVNKNILNNQAEKPSIDTITVHCAHDWNEFLASESITCDKCHNEWTQSSEMWNCKTCAVRFCAICYLEYNENKYKTRVLSNTIKMTKHSQRSIASKNTNRMFITTRTLEKLRRMGTKVKMKNEYRTKKDGTIDKRCKKYKEQMYIQKHGKPKPKIKRTLSQYTKRYIAHRQGYKCGDDQRGCGMLLLSWDVDHIVALADGGTDDEDNLIALCPTCHRNKTVTNQALFGKY